MEWIMFGLKVAVESLGAGLAIGLFVGVLVMYLITRKPKQPKTLTQLGERIREAYAGLEITAKVMRELNDMILEADAEAKKK